MSVPAGLSGSEQLCASPFSLKFKMTAPGIYNLITFFMAGVDRLPLSSLTTSNSLMTIRFPMCPSTDVTQGHLTCQTYRRYSHLIVSWFNRIFSQWIYPIQHDTLRKYWFNVGPASETMGQHWLNVLCFFGSEAAITLYSSQLAGSLPSKHEISTQCWLDDGPASQKLGQH